MVSAFGLHGNYSSTFEVVPLLELSLIDVGPDSNAGRARSCFILCLILPGLQLPILLRILEESLRSFSKVDRFVMHSQNVNFRLVPTGPYRRPMPRAELELVFSSLDCTSPDCPESCGLNSIFGLEHRSLSIQYLVWNTVY